jgi:hypothetical protein
MVVDYSGMSEASFPNFAINVDTITGSVVASPSSLAPGMVLLQWDFELAVGEVVDIWRSTVNDQATATEVVQTRNTSYVDGPLTAGTYYYWTRRAFPGSGSYGNWDYTEYNGQAITVNPQASLVSTNSPSIPGQIAVVTQPPLAIQSCNAINDSVATWSVLSGGALISIDTLTFQTGTGSLLVNIPLSTTAIFLATINASSWNISAFKYLKVLYYAAPTTIKVTLYFGQSTYNEQSQAFTVTPNCWNQLIWNISGIASGSRSAVTLFGVGIQNTASVPSWALLDNAYADPGPSQIQAFDGDRLIDLYPKVYLGQYTGNATNGTVIQIPRNGVPSAIFTKAYNQSTYAALWWNNGMPPGYSELFSGSAAITTGITTVTNGSFTLGTNANVNANGVTYNFIVLWQD